MAQSNGVSNKHVSDKHLENDCLTDKTVFGKSTGIKALDERPIWNGSRVFGLETPTALMTALGHPQNRIPTIHVTGTNGKGSTCAFIASILYSNGHQVGQFTSPHLSNVTERCIINGTPTNRNAFCRAIEEVVSTADEKKLNPSFFELVCAASFLEFARNKLDYAVIEVGLGGRLDATNTIEQSNVTVITNVEFDHVDILGNTLADIAREKAGILRANVPVVLGKIDKEPLNVIKDMAKEIGSPVYALDEEFGITKSSEFFTDFGRKLHGTFKNIPLRGAHQIKNAAVATRVALLLGVEWKTICKGICATRWPGRLEHVSSENLQLPDILLDVAHNVDGIKAVMSFIKEHLKEEKQKNSGLQNLIFICSILKRKDWQQMVSVMDSYLLEFKNVFDVNSKIIWTKSDHKLATNPNDLNNASLFDGIVIEDAHCAVKEASKLVLDNNNCSKKRSLVVVLGSCYLVGFIRPIILGQKEFRTIEAIDKINPALMIFAKNH